MAQPAGSGERGVASLLAVVGMSLVLLGLVMTLSLVEGSARSISGQLRYQGQALNAASAGSVDALAWLQKQGTQPVTAFTPQRDLSATPPLNDTENASIGIVRTYPLTYQGNVWGRYEVRAPTVVDVTAQRGKTGNGTIWQFDSTGIVFVDRNGNGQLDWPDGNGNGVFDWGEGGEAVALKTVRSEAQRMALVLPAGNAALQSANCAAVNLAAGTPASNRVLGSTAGTAVACQSGTGTPTTLGATLTGNPPIQSTVDPYGDSIPAVFGVGQAELLALASVKATGVGELPLPLPAMSLIVIQGDAVFTPAHPLEGSGILVVLGDLTLQAASNSSFNGVIYVAGTYTQGGPSVVLGAVVAHEGITLVGGADITEVDWDPTMVQLVRNALGGYRFARAQNLVP